jgi:hypothetical protein
MKNPNAIAVWVASHVVIGVEALAQKYAGAKFGTFWEKEAVADVSTVVLYVGRNGLKAAVNRAWQTVKGIWTGPAATPPSAK